MATREYCSGASIELGFLVGKLRKLTLKIDQVPSIDKYKMLPHIQDLKIIITELDERICELVSSCPQVEKPQSYRGGDVWSANSKSVQKGNEFFDYGFGG